MLAYLKARFPLLPLSIFCLLHGLSIVSLSTPFSFAKTFGISFLYLTFLAHLRVLDEFKDYEYDSLHHPDRPVQQGLISLTTIKLIGVLNMLLMISLGFFLSSDVKMLIFLCVTLFYTILMFKEFWIKNFWNKSAVVYLSSHQIVLVPLFLFFFSISFGKLWYPTTIKEIAQFIFIMLPLLIFEIGRKIQHRTNNRGQNTSDTYSYVWGERNALLFFWCTLLVAGFLFVVGQNTISFFDVGLLFASSMGVICVFFQQKLLIRHAYHVMVIFCYTLPLLPLLLTYD